MTLADEERYELPERYMGRWRVNRVEHGLFRPIAGVSDMQTSEEEGAPYPVDTELPMGYFCSIEK